MLLTSKFCPAGGYRDLLLSIQKAALSPEKISFFQVAESALMDTDLIQNKIFEMNAASSIGNSNCKLNFRRDLKGKKS